MKLGKTFLETISDPYDFHVADWIGHNGGGTVTARIVQPDYILFRRSDGEPLIPDFTAALTGERREILSIFLRVHCGKSP